MLGCTHVNMGTLYRTVFICRIEDTCYIFIACVCVPGETLARLGCVFFGAFANR